MHNVWLYLLVIGAETPVCRVNSVQEWVFPFKTVVIQHNKSPGKTQPCPATTTYSLLGLTLLEVPPALPSAVCSFLRETYIGRALSSIRSFDLKSVLSNLLTNNGHYPPNHPPYKKATVVSPEQNASWMKWQSGKPLFLMESATKHRGLNSCCKASIYEHKTQTLGGQVVQFLGRT